MNKDSLSHTSWNYKYHIVFAPKYSVSEIMGYLKGKSSLIIFDRHENLKYKYGNRHFWCRGYFVDTVGKNAKKIEEYVKNQLQEDKTYDQLSPSFGYCRFNTDFSTPHFYHNRDT